MCVLERERERERERECSCIKSIVGQMRLVFRYNRLKIPENHSMSMKGYFYVCERMYSVLVRSELRE